MPKARIKAPGVSFQRHFTKSLKPGQDVAELFTWTRRRVEVKDENGTVTYSTDVEAPDFWSDLAVTVAAKTWFRRVGGKMEDSIRDMLRREADALYEASKYPDVGSDYFGGDDERRAAFRDEVFFVQAAQYAMFNTPVHVNLGVVVAKHETEEGKAALVAMAQRTKTRTIPRTAEHINKWGVYGGQAPNKGPQCSACFIQSVDDTMESLCALQTSETQLFRRGSGTGSNLSPLRPAGSPLGGGGTASGPVSFMRGLDAWAGVTKSGGSSRRAALMRVLDVYHPDVVDFIKTKSTAQKMIRDLGMQGWDVGFNATATTWTPYQNANQSVRVDDAFMTAATTGQKIQLHWPTQWPRGLDGDNKVKIWSDVIDASKLLNDIAAAAHDCGDPGMQYDTTINKWHTVPQSGRIDASNPCSEYMHLQDSACNLASLRLTKFLLPGGDVEVAAFTHVARTMFIAQEILVGASSYPTAAIAKNSHDFRPLGLGYCDLGALLMQLGLPYDSDAGRSHCAAVTSLLGGVAYKTSAELARDCGGPFAGWQLNRESMLGVIDMHCVAALEVSIDGGFGGVAAAGVKAWNMAHDLGMIHGFRNAQATVLAPTGCLSGTSLISTSNGLRRLDTLGNPDGEQWQNVSFDVYTDEGSQKATKFYINGIEEVVQITTERGYSLRGTTKHRVKLIDSDGEWVWRRLADIKKGDRVPLALGQAVGNPQAVKLPSVSEKMAWAGEHYLTTPSTMSADLAEIVGYFMGDGSLHSRGLRLAVTGGDDDVVDRLQALSKRLFNLDAHVQPAAGYTSVELHSVRLVEWWQACGFDKIRPSVDHKGKGWVPRTPTAILASNDLTVYRAFLRGLLEADGSATQGYVSWSTTKAAFADEIQSLFLYLGFVCSRREGISGLGSQMFVVRLLNQRSNVKFLSEIGFISKRKREHLVCADNPQSARYDLIPVSHALLERVLKTNTKSRAAAQLSHRRTKSLTRDLAERMQKTSQDKELAYLLGFFFDTIDHVELKEEELTYDLSVPSNVTYVANGFISHNTIGFALDCDTTGIEPDTALVKRKKLAGGGVLEYVNGSVEPALRRLGYDGDSIENITSTIKQTGAIPLSRSSGGQRDFDLAPQHLPVFATAFGQPGNEVSVDGHLKMMAAAQPFLSGAISKTVNVPSHYTVAQIRDVFVEAWKLGLKAVAVYRDGSKDQPLEAKTAEKTEETANQETFAAATPSAMATAPSTLIRSPSLGSFDNGGGARRALKSMSLPKIEHNFATQPCVVEAGRIMSVRRRLPVDVPSVRHKFSIGGVDGYVHLGFYDEAKTDIGEVFIRLAPNTKGNAHLIVDTTLQAASIALQHGADLGNFLDKWEGTEFAPSGFTGEGVGGVAWASSPLDYLAKWLRGYLAKGGQGHAAAVLNASQSVATAVPLPASASVSPAPHSSIQAPSSPVPCPRCSSPMRQDGACRSCPACGYGQGGCGA